MSVLGSSNFNTLDGGQACRALLNKGAKVVVRKDPERVRELALDDPGIRADIDTPREYAQWVGARKI